VTVLIVASKTDPAAMNIADRLIANFGFAHQTEHSGRTLFRKDEVLLLLVEGDSTGLSKLEAYQAKAVICVSRHTSESGRPTLTTHVPSNLGSNAHHGGEPRRLAWADPQRLKSALTGLLESSDQLKLGEYSVSLEATHHGPTELEVPVLFVEIGSKREQWLSPKAGEAAASAALKAATMREKGKSAVGFGGGHYSPKHTTLVVKEDFAIGHILPEYFFDDYDPYVVDQAFMKTLGGCGTAVIDWKGLKSGDRKTLVSTLRRTGIEVVRV